jgi:plasmid stabilization system protein ParE
MPTIQTFEILAEGITAHLVKVLARAFGRDEGTVRAWRHPKESDANPTGTGKGNPLDQAARLISIVHQYNPGNARQAAQYFAELVDELDHAAGSPREIGEAASILGNLRELMKEESDVAQVLIGAELDQHTLRRTRKEIAEERAALERLDAAVAAELESQEKRA